MVERLDGWVGSGLTGWAAARGGRLREVGERVGGWTPASVEMRMGALQRPRSKSLE